MPHKKKSGRAANGSGSIRKRTVTRNGRSYTYWEARVTVGMDPITGKQVQRTITGKTQQEVAQRAREIAVEVDQKTCKLPRAEHPEIRPLDSDTITRFLSVIQGHKFAPIYTVTLFTGMRQGEIWA